MMALYRLCRPRMAVSSSSSFQYLSTAALEQQTMATNNDGVNMMMNDEPETGARSIMTMKKNIRVSPKKLNLLAKQIRGLSAENALLQMQFSQKKKGTLVQKTIQNAVNLADIRYSIPPHCLEIERAFVGKGQYLKRIRYMGKGQHGTMHHAFSHLTIVLKEVDENKYQKLRGTLNKKKNVKKGPSTPAPSASPSTTIPSAE